MSKNTPKIVFHHAPWSRAASVRWLLEELGVPYEPRFVNVDAPGGAQEDYRAIHPHKKVPAIEYQGQVLTERAAITIYLADVFSSGKLAPALDDPMRAAYLRMLVYCDAVFDPCVTARARHLVHEPADYSFGSFEDVMAYLKRHLSEHPYAAGSRFTAADTQLASSLGFTMHFLKVVPQEPEFEAYVARATNRPAHARAQTLDAELMQRVQEASASSAS